MSPNCLLLALFLCAGAVSGEAYKWSGVPWPLNIKALFPCASVVSGEAYKWSGVPWPVNIKALFSCAGAASGEAYGLSGAPWPVNIKDPILKEIAEFAVSEFNKQSQKNLVFQNVVSGTGQLVAGRLYELVIAVRDGCLTVNYVGTVIERPWENFRNLTSFHQVI